MARIRAIKPDFFRHVELYNAEIETGFPLRVAFAGLWGVADREGRFRWRPEVIKLDVLPFDKLDFADVLDSLCRYGFIERYEVDGKLFAHIPSFKNHQIVNAREAQSTLPSPHGNAHACTCMHMSIPVQESGEQEQEQEHITTLSGKPDPAPLKVNKRRESQPELPMMKEPIPYADIVNHLNQVTGKNFMPTSAATQKYIKARWNQGFRLPDFITVIDKKAEKWLSDAKMTEFLRPETLFGNKFEGYLNESGAIASTSNPMREFRADDPSLNANPRGVNQ